MSVSAVTYYRSLKAKDQAPCEVTEAVTRVFWENSMRYGSRRISEELREQEIKAGRHQVRRILAKEGLLAIQPRSFVPRTTQSRHLLGYSPNLLLDLELPPSAPNEILVGDITYLPLQSGKWGYLATWMDLFSRKVVGWAVADNMEEGLILEAFKMVLRRRRLPAGAIVHSDRGGQYAGKRFRSLLRAHNLRQSMSRTGETYDNAFAESLFSRIKAELLEGGCFVDVSHARSELFNYLEGYYNRVRRHSGLGYVSPDVYERNFAAGTMKPTKKMIDRKPTKGIENKQHSSNTF